MEANILSVDDPQLEEIIGTELFLKLKEDIEVLESLIPEPDEARIHSGDQSPLFFGSAMTNFGVELFLKTFIDLARKPVARVSEDDNLIDPSHEEFTGFVFKLQANLDPRHRLIPFHVLFICSFNVETEWHSFAFVPVLSRRE